MYVLETELSPFASQLMSYMRVRDHKGNSKSIRQLRGKRNHLYSVSSLCLNKLRAKETTDWVSFFTHLITLAGQSEIQHGQVHLCIATGVLVVD